MSLVIKVIVKKGTVERSESVGVFITLPSKRNACVICLRNIACSRDPKKNAVSMNKFHSNNNGVFKWGCFLYIQGYQQKRTMALVL